MSDKPSTRWFTLVQRELQEYRVSLLWTPLVIALLLTGGMLVSVLTADRIAAVGQAFMEVVIQDDEVAGMNISIHIEDDSPGEGQASYRIEEDVDPDQAGDWNFSREWNFKPPVKPRNNGGASPGASAGDAPGTGAGSSDSDGYAYNPLLSVVNVLMTLVLVVVTVNYLLGSLFDDRRDRSILFWKSLPVSEWEVVLSKLVVALVVAPVVFLAASLLAQVVCALLAMLLVWRMDRDPFELVLSNIHFGRLLVEQVGGWLLTALWVAPIYAWLLAASALARRSPFMVGLVPVVALVLLEEILFGTEYLGTAIANHFPHQAGGGDSPGQALGFFLVETDWAFGQLLSLVGGLACAAVLMAAAVWLRRHRWEI